MEEVYFNIYIDALRDFRNTFINVFLRENRHKLIAYTGNTLTKKERAGSINQSSIIITPKKDITIVFDYDPTLENSGIVFRFPGDGFVYISCKNKEKSTTEFSFECKPNYNAREHISDKIYEIFGITIIL